MLAVFEKSVAPSPEALQIAHSEAVSALKDGFLARHFASVNPSSVTVDLGSSGFMAYSLDRQNTLPRLFAVVDDIFCLFNGHIENVVTLKQQYGLGKTGNEASIVIEAYRKLRDRGPFSPDQVVRDIEGKFTFVLFDSTKKASYFATDSDGDLPFFWGTDSQGYVVLSDSSEIVKTGCGKSFAPFPKGKTSNTLWSTWTVEEDTILERGVKQSGKKWTLIAKNIAKKSADQCRTRWNRVLDPTIVKGDFTIEEDKKLTEAVQKLGTTKWAEIALEIPGRKDYQCRQRWFNALDKERKGPWDEDEKKRLVIEHRRHGNEWLKIGNLLQRSASSARNKFREMEKKSGGRLDDWSPKVSTESPGKSVTECGESSERTTAENNALRHKIPRTSSESEKIPATPASRFCPGCFLRRCASKFKNMPSILRRRTGSKKCLFCRNEV